MESSSNVTSSAYEKMRALDTDTLVRIWKQGDRSEYSVVEQEAARKVLTERLGGLPGVATETGGAVIVDHDDDDVVVSGGSRWASFVSTLAGVLSWLLLALFVGLAGLSLWQNLQMGLPVQQLLLQLLTSSIYTLLMGLFYFTILQFAAKGLSLLQEIQEYAEYLVERK